MRKSFILFRTRYSLLPLCMMIKFILPAGLLFRDFSFNIDSLTILTFTTTDDLKLIANDLIARLDDIGYVVNIMNLDVYFARFIIGKRQDTIKD